jgi:hypothetical protein
LAWIVVLLTDKLVVYLSFLAIEAVKLFYRRDAMSRKILFVLMVVFLLGLVACGSQAQYSEMVAMEESAPMMADDRAFEGEMAAAPMEDMAFATGNLAEAGSVEMPLVAQQERLIIRTGNLTLVVKDTEMALKEIAQMADANGGWVVNSSVYQYDETAKSGDITIRVPASGFSSAMDALKEMAVSVQYESTSGQDVTEEYVDLESRLGNLEATADRVRGFMEDTETVEEALAVNQELSRLEGEIEVIKGRMQYLSQSAAFSTITANLTPDIVSQPVQVPGWQPQGVAKDAIEALIGTLQGLASFAIWFGIYILPVLLLVGVPLWLMVRFVWRRIRRRRDNRKAAVVEPVRGGE